LQPGQRLPGGLSLFVDGIKLKALLIVVNGLITLVQLHGGLGQRKMCSGVIGLQLYSVGTAKVRGIEITAIHVEVRYIDILRGALVRTLKLGPGRIDAMENVPARYGLLALASAVLQLRGVTGIGTAGRIRRVGITVR